MNRSNYDHFVAGRDRGAYISATCRTDATYAFIIASQVINPEKKDIKNLNKTIKSIIQRFDKGLKFVFIALDTLFMAVFVDPGSAANPDSSSQLGFVITMMDKKGAVHIVHHSSLEGKTVTLRVIASELFAMVHGFGISATI